MPRHKKYQNDLSEGWRKIHNFWKKTYNFKKEYSQTFISKILKKHNNPVICWSGGKDSTVMLHMIINQKPNTPVIFVDSGVDFPETINYIKKMKKEWNLNLIITKPDKDQTFWDVGKKYGWPIFGKNIASNVGRAMRTGNIRRQLSNFEKHLIKNNIKISAKCSYYIREKPSKIIEKNFNFDVKFIALRTDESRARARLWVDHGDYYFVRHYFSNYNGIWKSNPMAFWNDRDIWEYHKKNDIPFCDLYGKGHTRNGCWTCAMAIRNGQIKRLRTIHPKLFKKLVFQTEMGKVLFEAKKAYLSFYGNDSITKTLKDAMVDNPGFFD